MPLVVEEGYPLGLFVQVFPFRSAQELRQEGNGSVRSRGSVSEFLRPCRERGSYGPDHYRDEHYREGGHGMGEWRSSYPRRASAGGRMQ